MTKLASILVLLVMVLTVPESHSLPAAARDADDVITASELEAILDTAFPASSKLTKPGSPGNRSRRQINPAHCVDYLYVMAHTASHVHAGTNEEHDVEMVANGQTRPYKLKNPLPPADGYERHKGDLWKISMNADFGFVGCVNKGDIESIAIEENGDDGWKIDSIVTILRDNYGGGQRAYEVATVDMDANRWIQGDVATHKRFELNLIL